MGNRLSKIYTRTGDDGSTGLGDGTRIAKDACRMEVIGTVDELNCLLGVLQSELPAHDNYRAIVTAIQHDLFDLGGELSIPGYELLKQQRIEWLEQSLDDINADLPPLKNFILPGGNKAGALCHLARAVCRRAERTMVTLGQTEDINAAGAHYLNRLSDLLFTLARAVNAREGRPEDKWRPMRERQPSPVVPSDPNTDD